MSSSSPRLLFVLFCVAVQFGCANFAQPLGGAAEMSQVAVTENPGGERYPGKFIWHDLVTPDATSAAKFYEQLFGWQIEYLGKYAVMRNDGKLIAGILQVEPVDGRERDAVWIPSVSVDDVDSAIEIAEANGGTVLTGPVDMDQRGRAALISDPQRADLVLLSAKGGDPVDAEAQLGDWLWDEIWTDDPQLIEDFYQAVLGYDEVMRGSDYDVFMHRGQWRSGMRHLYDREDHMLWVPVVRVSDPEVMVLRVKELGGAVWITPQDAPNKGNTALISDTTGALLLIQRWPSQMPEGEAE
jgi:predicted enzyme related to lactoylglutathione lyase